MEIFHLLRVDDESGVSGKGIVAEGITFSDGTTIIKWLGNNPQKSEVSSLNIFNTKEDMIEVHGHGAKTKIVSAKLVDK